MAAAGETPRCGVDCGQKKGRMLDFFAKKLYLGMKPHNKNYGRSPVHLGRKVFGVYLSARKPISGITFRSPPAKFSACYLWQSLGSPVAAL